MLLAAREYVGRGVLTQRCQGISISKSIDDLNFIVVIVLMLLRIFMCYAQPFDKRASDNI